MSININPSQRSMEILLKECVNVPRIHHSMDIQKYCTERLRYMPKLYKLSQILIAVPSTQINII